MTFPTFAAAVMRMRAEQAGLALLEFALTLPIIMLVGGYGIELSYFALCHLKVSQYALNLADSASRVGVVASSGVSQLRETDINDVLQATKLQGDGIDLTTFGRVTLSSLENVAQDYDKTTTQRIHWQRCIGLKKGTGYDSTYGVAKTTAGADAPANWVATANDQYAGLAAASGMGDAGSMVSAPVDSGVMFVEINYDYQSLFGSLFIKPTKIHYLASFIVRDNRDFSQITNPYPAATASTCNLYSAGPTTLNAYK
jgi:Flp pilus assembly protein TadG